MYGYLTYFRFDDRSRATLDDLVGMPSFEAEDTFWDNAYPPTSMWSFKPPSTRFDCQFPSIS